jgi:hypothetical protein
MSPVPRDIVEFFHFFGLSGFFGFSGLFCPSETTNPKTSHGINLFGPSEIGSPLSSLLIPQGKSHFMGQVKIVKIAHY